MYANRPPVYGRNQSLIECAINKLMI